MKIAIIGAGVTGLVAGYKLSLQGHEVTIFEKSKDIGGLLGGFKIHKTSLEKAYHHIFETDENVINLIEELGLFNKLRWHEDKLAVYYEGTFYPFGGAIDLLRFEPLDFISKVRLGLVKLWLQFDNNWQKYEKELAYKWMRKYCGEEAYKVIWEPLLKGKFHDKYKKVSMAWLWARIHTRGGSRLGYLNGGFGQITEKLAQKIKEKGGKIILNTETRFKKQDSRIGREKFDKVLHTGPSKEVEYLGAVVGVFTSKQDLSPYYWHNINDPKSPILCFIQHTNLVDKKHYGGRQVYYLGTYIPHDHKYFMAEEKVVWREWLKYLAKIWPEFNEKQIEKKWMFRLKNAQHVVGTNYKKQDYRLQKNIYQANFSMIYPEDRGINFAVREGEKVAKLINNE